MPNHRINNNKSYVELHLLFRLMDGIIQSQGEIKREKKTENKI